MGVKSAANRATLGVIILLLPLAGCGGGEPLPFKSTTPPNPAGNLPTVDLKIGDVPVTVEVAREENDIRRGLMFRRSLPRDRGMIFIFPDEDYRRFWMKNTRIPLDILFVKQDGTISHTAQMKPLDKTPVSSRYKVKYVLELNRGWLGENHVQVGDKIELAPLTEQ